MPSKTNRNAIPRARNTSSQIIYSRSLESQTAATSTTYPADEPSASPPCTMSYLEPEPEPDIVREGIADTRPHQAQSDLPAVMYRRVSGDRGSSGGFVSQVQPVSPFQRQPSAADTGHAGEPCIERNAGHVRSPVLSREPTTLETFSRAIRNYVPSSIPIPSAAPSAPRVSRPMSFGSFLTPSMSPQTRGDDEDAPHTSKRRGSDISGSRSRERMSWGQYGASGEEGAVFSLDEEVVQDEADNNRRSATRYPGVEETEQIIWAGWDCLAGGDPAKTKRLLLLGYPSGLQIWDCSDLGSVSEILNLSGPQWGAVDFAAVLPSPLTSEDDQFATKRPLIGVLSRTRDWPDLFIYSLRTHNIVKTLSLIGLRSFSAVADFVVLSTSSPLQLHVLSSRSFTTLYTISSSCLAPFATTLPSFVKNNFTVSQLDLDQEHNSIAKQHQLSTIPQPTFALSNRLLAYVSPDFSLNISTPCAATLSRASASTLTTEGSSMPGISMSQADIANAAIKLGGSVLSGMKSLGGMAISAARAGVTAAAAGDVTSSSKAGPGSHGFTSMFFSRSAPATSGGEIENRSSMSSPGGRERQSLASHTENEAHLNAVAPSTTLSTAGYSVTVVDLRSLLSRSTYPSSKPKKVAEFMVSKPISNLKFSSDGTSLAVCLRNGHDVMIYQLRPAGKSMRPSSTTGDSREAGHRGTQSASGHHRETSMLSDSRMIGDPPWHVYDLRRGRTSAVVQGLDWANDGRWFAMGSRNRTVHVFAVNPYGGRPDEFSHLAGKVANVSRMPLSTVLDPVIRLRTIKTAPPDHPSAPLAFTFIRPSDVPLPSALVPASMPYSPSSSPSSIHSATHSKPVSPVQRARKPTNFQDLLIFDSYDGTLSLSRLLLHLDNNENVSIANAVPLVGGTSISLPGMSTLSKSGKSPTNPSNSPRKASALTQMMEKPSGLIVRETKVGTWNLRRGRDWTEVRQVLAPSRKVRRPLRAAKADWLSCAELSTCSASPQVLPRSIYLSHQFSFHSLGEDYHALIRSGQLDIPGNKIEVRKKVEVNAYPPGLGESFMQGPSAPRDIGPVSSSFDEPLASALSVDLQYTNPSPPVLPMFPNGTPGSNSRSLKHTIPIRTVAAGIGDSMSESLVRLRREIGKVRSPRLAPRMDDGLSASVPLEFVEEDEDFMGGNLPAQGVDDDAISRSLSRGEVDSGESISTPSTNFEPLPVDDDLNGDVWQGWEPEDQQAIEDAERFDDITVGFMDEEHASMREVEKKRVKKGRVWSS
ncbi:hypothetical protein AcV5_003752 [Taiwanofungus camphoratus]|nr:hypothetical protein AcV5_003752 [Antrodia cinnamomea]